jgi:hypothetical protein
MTINWHLSVTLWNGELEEMYRSGYILDPPYLRNDNNCFVPSILRIMRQNSEALSEHLCTVLRLSAANVHNNNDDDDDNPILTDDEIL